MSKFVLVTGASGFIGSNIARSLAADGYQIVVSDWFGTGDKWRNLVDVDLYDIVKPELALEWLATAAAEVSAIVHMGAISATTESDVDKIIHHNFNLTLQLWQIAAQNNIRFIFASSAAVYGDGQRGFLDDEDPRGLASLRPLNPYGWSKLLVDRRLLFDVAHGRGVPIQWAGLRFFNVYGPGEDHKGDMRSVINKMYPEIVANRPVKLFKSYRFDFEDGEQLRDFIHVDDCVSVIRWLLDNPAVSGIFNCGSGEARSFNDLARSIYAATCQLERIEYIEMPMEIRNAYQYYTQADMTKLKAAGYERPFLSLEDGIASYIRNHLSRNAENSI